MTSQGAVGLNGEMTLIARGYILGLIGVAIFAMSLPLTRVAVVELDPIFISMGRTVIAAIIGGLILIALRQPWPQFADLKLLGVVVFGVIFGFPIFSAIAMQTVPASHGGVVLGALPLATAVMSTVFAGERPSPAFWFWCVAGSCAVIVFTLWSGGGLSISIGDIWLILAVIAAGAGYAAGGHLSRSLGGWQVICWALLLALPATLPIAMVTLPTNLSEISPHVWMSFIYLGLMSQLIGFFFWNRGLALGGVARVGQIQLLQTFIMLGVATVVNNEPLTLLNVVFGCVVAACVWFGRKAKVGNIAR